MKNIHKLPVSSNNKPTQGGQIDIDQLAKLWIELVLRQIQKAPVVSFKDSSYNNVIGLLNS